MERTELVKDRCGAALETAGKASCDRKGSQQACSGQDFPELESNHLPDNLILSSGVYRLTPTDVLIVSFGWRHTHACVSVRGSQWGEVHGPYCQATLCVPRMAGGAARGE